MKPNLLQMKIYTIKIMILDTISNIHDCVLLFSFLCYDMIVPINVLKVRLDNKPKKHLIRCSINLAN